MFLDHTYLLWTFSFNIHASSRVWYFQENPPSQIFLNLPENGMSMLTGHDILVAGSLGGKMRWCGKDFYVGQGDIICL